MKLRLFKTGCIIFKRKEKGGLKMWQNLNEKVKKLTVIDIGLTKLSVFFLTIILVKLLPVLLAIRYRYLVILVVVCAADPLYKFFFKK